MLKRALAAGFRNATGYAKLSSQQTKAVAQPLRPRKPKAPGLSAQNFADLRHVRVLGGKGGDGCVSFLQLWANDRAGPDGGDGGNGGHVILRATADVKDLAHMPSMLKAEDGEQGCKKDCNGKSAQHRVIDVPLGTVIKDGASGGVVGDLSEEGMMFVAARGGSGGKGNRFFMTDVEQSPMVAEYGAQGEDLEYTVEMRTMAHVGLIGLPNAGKSTLLRAISRAKPKVAPYPFTTLKPHLGMVQYDDYEQVAVADLPGLIPDSHKNKGLGIQFLRHAERCMALLYIVDLSLNEPEEQVELLQHELKEFSPGLLQRPQIIVANKIDLEGAEESLERLRKKAEIPVIGVSAKNGTNLKKLLEEIKIIYDTNKEPSGCEND